MTTHVTLDFSQIKNAVESRFADMMQQPKLYRTAVDTRELWDKYLASFPEGTNPTYRKRTEHDCSCCRQFIRTVGNVVAIIEGDMVSIWDLISISDPAYHTVAKAMSKFVKASYIQNVFMYSEKSIGTEKNFAVSDGTTIAWKHFHVELDRKFRTKKDLIPAILGGFKSHFDVAMRGLRELSIEAIDTVLDLINQNSLYRGEEHKDALLAFKKIKLLFDVLPEKRRNTFVWEHIDVGALHIRNTVIGTLLQDLSAGVDLEDAVKSFETKVAPTNYKRPTALVTKSMIENAKKAVEALGLTSALHRRFAVLDDITINNVLFADRSLRKKLGGENIFDELSEKAGTHKERKLDSIEEISIDKFIEDVLPRVDSVEVLFEGKHQSNLMSLIAPMGGLPDRLFKWPNQFSWSYNGEVADSIKERVKKAGGSVTGELCNRLAWFNYDDLDLHMLEPNRYELYYATKYAVSPCGGRLDVDMNAGGGTTREPVENIFYTDRRRMAYGIYTLFVEQFQARESQDIGFEVEIDWLGDTYNFSYNKPMRTKEKVVVAEFNYTKAGMRIASKLPNKRISKQVWNINTNAFHKAQAIMLSPNHWDGTHVGNKHWFFLLDQCKNDGTARGFFNEFLSEDLTQHRKVLEIVGSKTKVEESDNQLSGLGFSSTKGDKLVVRVKGSFTRELKIVF